VPAGARSFRFRFNLRAQELFGCRKHRYLCMASCHAFMHLFVVSIRREQRQSLAKTLISVSLSFCSGVRGRFLRQNSCFGTGKAWPELGCFVTEIFFYILRKRASLGRAFPVPKQSFVWRTGLCCVELHSRDGHVAKLFYCRDPFFQNGLTIKLLKVLLYRNEVNTMLIIS
jgi:hypothetical protein